MNINPSPCRECTYVTCASKDCEKFEDWFMQAWNETVSFLRERLEGKTT